MKKEKRSLFNLIFGNKQDKQKAQNTYLKMLNSYTPIYTTVGKNYSDYYLIKTCINTIATHGAKMLPKHIKNTKGNVIPFDGEINYLLSKKPNPWMNTYDFLYKIITILYKYNNAFVFIHKDNTGMITGFYPIEAGAYELWQDEKNEIYLDFKFINGQEYILPYKEIIHLRRFYDSHELYGDPNDSLKAPIEVANTAMQGIDNAIKTSSYLRGILKFTQNMLKQSDPVKFKDNFVKDFMNIENESGIAVLDQRAEFQEVNTSPVTLTKEQLAYTKENIYNYFNINEDIIRGKFTDDEWNAYFESVIEPLSIQLSLEFTNKIFTKEAVQDGHKIIFSVDRIQYAKTTTKIQMLKELAILGLYTVDEARAIMDMSPIGGDEGSKRIQTLNVINTDIADQYQSGKNEVDTDDKE